MFEAIFFLEHRLGIKDFLFAELWVKCSFMVSMHHPNNPFVPKAPFLYPLKPFHEVEKRCIGNEWVNELVTPLRFGSIF